MPLMDIESAKALKSLRNRPSLWPDGRGVSDRFNGIVKTSIRPKFAIHRTDKIFTMGSCFARNIERRLSSMGFDVPIANVKHEVGSGQDQGLGIMNKYTIHSMSNEMAWAADGYRHYKNRSGHKIEAEDFYIEEENGSWFDPHFHGNSSSMEFVQKLRYKYESELAKFTQCDVFIFTLGLAETWYDSRTSLYLNRMPPISSLKREPERFRFHILSHGEIVAELEDIYQL